MPPAVPFWAPSCCIVKAIWVKHHTPHSVSAGFCLPSVLTNQLLRSGTSIGANIHESKYGHGTADFIAKMQIALKECYESEYWLELLNRTGYIPTEQYKPLLNDCGSIRRMLIASINTVKENIK